MRTKPHYKFRTLNVLNCLFSQYIQFTICNAQQQICTLENLKQTNVWNFNLINELNNTLMIKIAID